MPGPPILNGPFTMPMVKDFIPRRMQPWLYIVFAVIFQMVSGVYMGNELSTLPNGLYIKEGKKIIKN